MREGIIDVFRGASTRFAGPLVRRLIAPPFSRHAPVDPLFLGDVNESNEMDT